MDRCTRSTRGNALGVPGSRTSAAATARLAAGPRARGAEDTRSDPLMMHVTCDLCGKELRPGEDHHFVVKVEVFSAHDPAELTEDDLDEDHMEAFGEMLREMEEDEEAKPVPPACQQLRYDLCSPCRQRYLRDPLGK